MKNIPLASRKYPGLFVKIDDADWNLIGAYRWHVLQEHRPGRTHGPYAITNRRADGSPRFLRMHCLIMGTTGIDHRDGDGLNNQRHNLRIATDSQNHGNERPGLNGTSLFKGVYWDSNRQKWAADIKVNRCRIHLGRFANEEDAARAYDAAAIRAWGEYAWLNFKDLRVIP